MNKFRNYGINELKNAIEASTYYLESSKEDAKILEKEIGKIPAEIAELTKRLRVCIEDYQTAKRRITENENEIEEARRELHRKITPAF